MSKANLVMAARPVVYEHGIGQDVSPKESYDPLDGGALTFKVHSGGPRHFDVGKRTGCEAQSTRVYPRFHNARSAS